jgi:S-adenosylmethionine:tRNA ribosyltransferase-isomerase
MDSEYFCIGDEECEAINAALASPHNKVTTVGTTCVRALESSISASDNLKSGSGWTDKFIYPPYEFRITERLITNFHMPGSTLLMLVSAFSDRELMMHAYEQAIENEYRLFSFGDAMIIV